MLKICLSKNTQKSKFHDFTHTLGEGVGRGYQNEEILKFVPSRLLNSPTSDNNQGNQLFFAVYI